MLENMQLPQRKNNCGMHLLWEQLNGDDREILRGIINDKAWSHQHLTSELQRLGFKITYGAVKNHRLNQCNCWRIQEGLGDPR